MNHGNLGMAGTTSLPRLSAGVADASMGEYSYEVKLKSGSSIDSASHTACFIQPYRLERAEQCIRPFYGSVFTIHDPD